ncbi:nitrite reductase small subunit NirD [Paraglaciecola hydrolytica]|uniref:Nitrite reductase small subunit n=1 Tax=Paraglaciecola hydrolytica TaxID=1799789 RepID=A0A136A645_9ALTE|nr:nitrite reductase small subunit NirD [Paraglaciecola hydrolytica]KXI30681.1 nitrite reductase small subunit [Paraglaciecola hydrolytica]
MTNSTNWITVCQESDLVANSGVCALINEQQIALFKVKNAGQEQLFAISNWDPIGEANVLYRGLLCSVGDTVAVASPLYKQRFCLSSGTCLDSDDVTIKVYPIRLENQAVQLQVSQ